MNFKELEIEIKHSNLKWLWRNIIFVIFLSSFELTISKSPMILPHYKYLNPFNDIIKLSDNTFIAIYSNKIISFENAFFKSSPCIICNSSWCWQLTTIFSL